MKELMPSPRSIARERTRVPTPADWVKIPTFPAGGMGAGVAFRLIDASVLITPSAAGPRARNPKRSEEHTSELQSRGHLVCRLLLEKKKGNRMSRRESPQ